MGTFTLSILACLIICFISGFCHADDDAQAFACPDHQEGFEASCYEFVSIQQSFLDAEGFCERGGGHLAFILNDEIQQFLQKHLEPGLDWWLGLAPAAPNLTLDTTASEGKLNLYLIRNEDGFLRCYFRQLACPLCTTAMCLFNEQPLRCR